MTIRYHSYPVKQGAQADAIDELGIPEPTRSALCKAGGALERTVYLAYRDDEAAPSATLLGYRRPYTAQHTLTALAGEQQLWTELVNFAERQCLKAGIAIVKRDSSMQEDELGRSDVGHYLQTTEFTCGPSALLNVLTRRGIQLGSGRDEEIAMWREATLGVACDPYGLAVASARRGVKPVLRVSREGPVLHPDSRLGILDPALAERTQRDFERQAHELGLTIHVEGFDAENIVKLVDAGHIAVVLIDELAMHGVSCPHWVAVTGVDHVHQVLLVDDPWVDAEFGETGADVHQLPIRPADLDAMIHYDSPRSAQAMLLF